MSWVELLERKAPLRSIFGEQDPGIESIVLHEVSLHRDGPRVDLRFDVSQFPRTPPRKWVELDFNTVQIILSLVSIHHLVLDGWGTANAGDLKLLQTSPRGLVVEFTSASTKLKILCDSALVARVSAYHDTAREQRS